MSRLVLAHPAVADGARPDAPLALFDTTGDPRFDGLRSDSLGYIVAGALALGMTGRDFTDDLAQGLVLAGVSTDPASLLQRHTLAGGKPFEEPPPAIPEWLDRIDDFIKRNCFAGVVGAVLELGKYAGSAGTSDATGISSLSPTSVCPGTKLTISGSGFGATQPADTKVYVPSGGGCREATVTRWSDTAIDVTLPADVSAGCVGFVRGGTQNFGGLQKVTGELTTCVGAVGEIWGRGFSKVGTPIVTCPPCLPGGQNRIQSGGRPSINAFRFTPAHNEPGGTPVLSWSVANATNITIAGVAGNGPALALPAGSLPPVGSLTLSPVTGSVPVHGTYRMTASNACGTVTADAQLEMTETPMLGIIRIEVVQSIQKVDNSVPLTASRRTAVRVFVDSGITDGFDWGNGPNRVGGRERLGGGGEPRRRRDVRLRPRLARQRRDADAQPRPARGLVQLRRPARRLQRPRALPRLRRVAARSRPAAADLGDRRGRRGVHAQGLAGAAADADRRPVEHRDHADDGRLLRRLQRPRRAGARPAVPGRRLHRQPAAVVLAGHDREPQVGAQLVAARGEDRDDDLPVPEDAGGRHPLRDRAVRQLVPLGRDGAAADRR